MKFFSSGVVLLFANKLPETVRLTSPTSVTDLISLVRR